MANDFSFDTIKDFDNHINNSIMGYDLLHNLIINVSEFFIQKEAPLPIIDLGCTSGILLSKLKKKYPFIQCIGYDKTDHNFIDDKEILLQVKDLTNKEFTIPNAQIIYSIFTLQFIPFTFRKKILTQIYNSLYDNGALFICEKEYAESAKLQEVYTFANYSNKQQNFSDEEILKKEKDIRTLMSPLTSKENRLLLKESGFTKIGIFFKSLNFTGYICQK